MVRLPLQIDNTAPGASRIVPEGTTIEMLRRDHVFTEGPVWDDREGALFYTDIVGNTIEKWIPDRGGTTVMELAGHPDGMALDEENRLVVAGWGARTVWRWEHDGSTKVLAARYQGKKLNSPNDIVVKSDGTIWWTDPNGGLFNVGMCDFDVQKALDFQGIFRIAPDGSDLSLVASAGFENPNGLCFSPDESLLYVNDTPRQHIRVFDVRPDGSLANDRVFAATKGTEPGGPDGLKVDVEGNVYCTGPGGIHVFDPDGGLLCRMLMPGPPANFGWGDPDFRGMYVTAREMLYRIRLGIAGVPHGPQNRRKALAAART